MSPTAVATKEQTNTRTQTATYLAEVILGAVADIVATLGLDPSKLDIQDIERAIVIWLAEQSMEKLVLECYTPADGLANLLDAADQSTITVAAKHPTSGANPIVKPQGTSNSNTKNGTGNNKTGTSSGSNSTAGHQSGPKN